MRVLILVNAPAIVERWEGEAASDRGVEHAATAVRSALERRGHQVVPLLVGADPGPLLRAVHEFKPDAVFNLCETIGGNSRLEAAVPFLLRWLKVPCTGNTPEALVLLLDKICTKRLLRDVGLPTPPFAALYDVRGLDGWGDWPAILKPSTEDASLGIDVGSVVSDVEAAKDRFELLFDRFGLPVLIERYIDGRELNVAILATEDGLRFGINEIDYSELPSDRPKILTYDAKWSEESEEFMKTPVKAPAVLEPALDAEVRSLAATAFSALDLRGYARLDLRIDADGKPWILELNPNPDIGPGTGFVKSLPQMGLGYDDAIEQIARMALKSK
ncbi:MAG TPA: ATP-grasp domain-containing protein [Candidatus Ozemobacteraceae bacterium]|nr:ATP-grasp domain-containing protein [Candidatus Ozemobacteraceae bacterium]